MTRAPSAFFAVDEQAIPAYAGLAWRAWPWRNFCQSQRDNAFTPKGVKPMDASIVEHAKIGHRESRSIGGEEPEHPPAFALGNARPGKRICLSLRLSRFCTFSAAQLHEPLGKYQFYTNDLKQWADWGLDYLKWDWNPNKLPETKEMDETLKATNRDILFSLSNQTPFKSIAEL